MNLLASIRRTARSAMPVALGVIMAACGARPSAPVGQSTHALARSGTPTAAPVGFWRFYSRVEGGDRRDPEVCQPTLDELPPALQQRPIRSELLFAEGQAVPAPDGRALERVFCAHSTELTRAEAEALPDVVGAPLEFVPPRVSALAERDIKRSAAARFALHAGAPRASVGGDRVRVAVLDSAAPGADGLPGTGGVAPHGEDMALLVRRLVCPGNEPVGARCAIEVETDVALDLDADADGLQLAPGGGRFGDPGMVARAIHRAVDRAAVDGVPLVINLSLGWLDDGDARVSVQAVRAAIEQARDRGVVVVAAAGNDTDGALSPAAGLMLPARWSTEQHPDGAPLLLSAGARGVDGDPVANAREYGAPGPSAWAYGAHAPADARFFTAGDRATRLDGALWTGSSVAAAVISAGAAATMSAAGSATAVFDRIAQHPGPVGVCALADLPCAGGSDDGPDLAGAPATAPLAGRPVNTPDCGGETRAPDPTAEIACPSAVVPNPIGLPRVDPQPDFPGCDVCAFDALSGKLVVKVSADTAWLTLKTTDSNGVVKWTTLADAQPAGAPTTYDIGPGSYKHLEVSGKVTVGGKTTAFEDPVMMW